VGFFGPAGTPHFIGEGILVVELQEPTDLSILLEWDGLAVDGDREGHLGLGFDVALRAVDTRVWSAHDVDAAVRPLPWPPPATAVAALPDQAAPYFRAHWVSAAQGAVQVEAGFAVLVVLDGRGRLTTTDGGSIEVGRGDLVLLPWSAGDWTLGGTARGLVCRPPAPDAPAAPR
jgi:mannose-6-phosphate isomerase